MPTVSVTTTATDVFFGGQNVTALAFKNGSSAGIIYIRNKQHTQTIVTSTSYEISLKTGESIGFSSFVDGEGIIGPWQAISDTVGGVTLEVLPIYLKATRGR